MNILPGLLSIVIFIAVFVSNCISLKFLKNESVKSYTNITSWVINCALANFVHCLFILPIGIGLYSVESKDFQSVEDFWMEIETPISLQFHSVALLAVIFFEYVGSKRLARVATYALLSCNVIIVTVVFMVPSVIIKVVYTEKYVTNVTDSLNITSGQESVSSESDMYALLCTTITAVALPSFLLIVCHPFTRQNFHLGKKRDSLQCLNNDGKSPFIQHQTIPENNYDTDDVASDNDGARDSVTKPPQEDIESADDTDDRLEIKLRDFRNLQRRLHQCGMLTSPIGESEDESQEVDTAIDSETSDTDEAMVGKFYINAVLHFVFWCPWIIVNFINYKCQDCEISPIVLFYVSLLPCVGMIFTPVLINMPDILTTCT
jgi:hypothetical protein